MDLSRVALDAGGVQVEGERGAVVVVGVDDHAQPVRVQEVHVPPAQAHGGGRLVVEAHADVEGLVVEEDAGLGALAHRLALLGIHLREVGHGRRRRPRGLVQAPVDVDGPGGAHRLDHGAALVQRGPGVWAEAGTAPRGRAARTELLCLSASSRRPLMPPLRGEIPPARNTSRQMMTEVSAPGANHSAGVRSLPLFDSNNRFIHPFRLRGGSSIVRTVASRAPPDRRDSSVNARRILLLLVFRRGHRGRRVVRARVRRPGPGPHGDRHHRRRHGEPPGRRAHRQPRGRRRRLGGAGPARGRHRARGAGGRQGLLHAQRRGPGCAGSPQARPTSPPPRPRRARPGPAWRRPRQTLERNEAVAGAGGLTAEALDQARTAVEVARARADGGREAGGRGAERPGGRRGSSGTRRRPR